MTKSTIFAAKVPNWLGDSVLAIPAIKAIAECARRGRLVILASNISYEVMKRVPETLVFQTRTAGAGIVNSVVSAVKGGRILRQFRPVIVFSFTRSATSAITCYLGRVPRRIGFSDSALAALYTDRVSQHWWGEHLLESYCRLPESLGIKVHNRIPALDPLDEDIAKGKRIREQYDLKAGGYFCFFPGATYGAAKRWHAGRFALLADLVADRLNATPVILGSNSDSEACNTMHALMKTVGRNLCGRIDLGSLIGLLKSARGAVANDSGGMHLAAALGIPVVGLFFSSDPAWTRPISPVARYIYKGFECSPCFKRDCERGNACTETISVEEVFGTVNRLLAENQVVLD